METWPEPGTLPKRTLAELPVGARVLGLAPVGIRWEGTVVAPARIRPDKGCPHQEFAPCFAFYKGEAWEIS